MKPAPCSMRGKQAVSSRDDSRLATVNEVRLQQRSTVVRQLDLLRTMAPARRVPLVTSLSLHSHLTRTREQRSSSTVLRQIAVLDV